MTWLFFHFDSCNRPKSLWLKKKIFSCKTRSHQWQHLVLTGRLLLSSVTLLNSSHLCAWDRHILPLRQAAQRVGGCRKSQCKVYFFANCNCIYSLNSAILELKIQKKKNRGKHSLWPPSPPTRLCSPEATRDTSPSRNILKCRVLMQFIPKK